MSDQPAPKSNGLPVKTLILIAFMLVGETALIIGGIAFIASPKQVIGNPVEQSEFDPLSPDKTVEVNIFEDKLTNDSTGRTFLYNTEIVALVDVQHEPKVRQILEQRIGKIRTGFAGIWGSAQAAHFKEPNRETLSQQSLEFLREVFGTAPNDQELIYDVLIPKLMGFPAEF